jgi:DNA-directed RNA polymerase alpha subunit
MDMMYLEQRPEPERDPTPLQQLALTTRSRQALEAGVFIDGPGMHFVKTIGDLVECSARDLLRTPNFGKKCLEEVRDKLSERGAALRGERPQDLRLKMLLSIPSTLGQRLDDIERKLDVVVAILRQHHRA